MCEHMSRNFLIASLYFIGIAGVIIGSAFIMFGVNATGQFFNSLLSIFTEIEPLIGLNNSNAESELRFYSVFWIAYGVLLIRAARDLRAQMAYIPVLIGLFFAGGAARLISYFTAGPPHILFVLLMLIELSLPIAMLLCWQTLNRAKN